jgi:hypothetical protein
MDNQNQKQNSKIKKLSDNMGNVNVALLDSVIELTEAVEKIKIDTPDFTETNKLLTELLEESKKKEDEEEVIYSISDEDRAKLKGDKGEKGEKGDKGDNYNLTETDKEEIALQIEVPIVEKVIEIKEVAIKDTPEEIKIKLETLKDDERLSAKAIKDLDFIDQAKLDFALGVLDSRTRFLISSIQQTQPSGGVTSVTASLPLSSSGGSTPNISITQSGSSTDGYLSSTDWNTFNNKLSSTLTHTHLFVGDSSNNAIDAGSDFIYDDTNGNFSVGFLGDVALNADYGNGLYTFGDVSGSLNGTQLRIEDINSVFNLINPSGNVGINDGTPEFTLSIDKDRGTPDGSIIAKATFGFGNTLLTNGAGTRLIWYGQKSAFRAGTAVSTEWDDINIGVHSTAFGEGNIASGTHAMAWGGVASATNNYATAWGASTLASGIGSTAFGNTTQALGFYATSFGESTIATGDGSLAIGNSTDAQGTYSFAQGNTSIASSDFAVAMGDSCIASGVASFAGGSSTQANGGASFALGSRTVANADYSAAWGSRSNANFDYSTAWGSSTTADAIGATVWGESTYANGLLSTAFGYFTNANADYATAWGDQAVASAVGATAWGSRTNATADNATAMGSRATASGVASLAMGDTTDSQGQYSFAGGAGSIALGEKSIAFGDTAQANGRMSFALGSAVTANGNTSFAWGSNTTADGNESMAGGINTYTQGAGAVALGNTTQANGFASFAMGENHLIDGSHSIGFGLNHTVSGAVSGAFGEALDIQGNNAFGFNLNSTPQTITDSNVFIVTGGNVGIGTVSPQYLLHTVTANSAVTSLAGGITAENTNSAGYASINMENDLGSLAQMVMTGSTFSSGIFVSNSTSFYGNGAGGTNFGSISATAPVVFFSGGTALANERMRLTAAGKLLIGTTTTGSTNTPIKINTIPAYNNDAAAGVAGLVAGDIYRTTGAGAAPLNVAGIVMVKL